MKNKYVTKDGNLKFQTVKNLLTTTNELWIKVNQIAEECGVPAADFIKAKEAVHKTIYRPSDIVYKVNKRFHVNVNQKSRKHNVSKAKHALCFLLKKYTTLSLYDIAKTCHNKEHTSSFYSIKKCGELMETDTDYRNIVLSLMNDIEKEVVGVI